LEEDTGNDPDTVHHNARRLAGVPYNLVGLSSEINLG